MPAYASIEEFPRYGMKAEAVDDPENLANALEAASREADSYLASRHAVPLETWPESLKLHVCAMAAWILLRSRGTTIDGTDDVIRESYLDSIRWLKDVGAGRATLVGGTSATAPSPAAPFVPTVESEPLRGW